MNSIQLIKRLHEHRIWADRNLAQAMLGLSTTQLHADFAIGQGSIWKSLCHMYAAEFVWLAALRGNSNATAPGDLPGKLPGNQLGTDAFQNVNELISAWENIHLQWNDYLNSITEETLTETVQRTNSLTGATSSTHCYDVLLHVCTHAHYTTAQVINMYRHSGMEKLPDTMHIVMARQQMTE